jgi:hypothetical protein
MPAQTMGRLVIHHRGTEVIEKSPMGYAVYPKALLYDLCASVVNVATP